MQFYIPKEGYLDYLRGFESKIMQSKNQNYSNEKMVFGAVLEIDGFNYYIPLSSKKNHQISDCSTNLKGIFKKISFPIRGKSDEILALLRCDYMFPIPNSELILVDIDSLESKYRDLVEEEYFYCKTHFEAINQKATDVYTKAKKPTHFLNQQCCNFLLLEIKHNEWIKKDRT